MKSSKKENILFAIAIIIFLVFLVRVILFPTGYEYCNMLIIGNSLENVEEMYGEFDYVNERRVGYFLHIKEGLTYYYWMDYDEDGTIYDVYVEVLKGG